MITANSRSHQSATVSELDLIDTFAIGDVHGRADLLAALLDTIRSSAGSQRYQVVFLGDLIDRGPSSREVLLLAAGTITNFPGSCLLIGNHEEFLLRFLEKPTDIVRFRTWMDNGGVATLRSFGITSTVDRNAVVERLTKDNRISDILSNGVDIASMGRVVFVHAGIRPLVPLDEQNSFDVRWIREPFLRYLGIMPWLVVHGHTPTVSGDPEITRNRINIDTGAFATGRLFSLKVPATGEPLSFLCAKECKGGVKVEAWQPLP